MLCRGGAEFVVTVTHTAFVDIIGEYGNSLYASSTDLVDLGPTSCSPAIPRSVWIGDQWWRMYISGTSYTCVASESTPVTSLHQHPRPWCADADGLRRASEARAGCSVLTVVQWIWLCVANCGHLVIVDIAPSRSYPAACLLSRLSLE